MSISHKPRFVSTTEKLVKAIHSSLFSPGNIGKHI